MAYYRYFSAVARGRPLVWLKTEHAYPNRAALVENRRKLGEVLVGCQYITTHELQTALASKPDNVRLGDYLVRIGQLSDGDVYEALSLQQNVPYGKPEPEIISRPVTRSLPAEFARRWKVLPYKVAAGHLFDFQRIEPVVSHAVKVDERLFRQRLDVGRRTQHARDFHFRRREPDGCFRS